MSELHSHRDLQAHQTGRVADEDTLDLLSYVSDLGGSGLSAAAGLLLAGPPGALLGAVLAPSFSTVVKDVAKRWMSHREKARVAAAVVYAHERIRERLNAGHTPRDDGFFKAHGNERPRAEEIFEGTLQKCRNEHEEKKIRFIANIVANVAFARDVSAGEANRLLQLAYGLTYRKMCILALVARKGELPNISFRSTFYPDTEEHPTHELPPDLVSVVLETFDLVLQGTLTAREFGADGNAVLHPTWESVVPDDLRLTYLGRRCVGVLGLDGVPEEDIADVAQHLSYVGDLRSPDPQDDAPL